MTVADRIAVMKQGKIVQVDPPIDMYEQPANRYVADFLGNINLIDVKIVGQSDGVMNLESADGIALQARCEKSYPAGSDVFFAIRPEKLHISLEKPQGANCLAATVWDIAYLGDLTIYKVRLDGGEFAKVSVLNRTLSAARAITWEDRVWLSCEPDAALVLEA